MTMCCGSSHTVIPMPDFTVQAGGGEDFFMLVLLLKRSLRIQKQHQICTLSVLN